MARQSKYPGITKIANGYHVRVTAVDPRTGKLRARKEKLVGASLEDAVTKAEELRREIRTGRSVPVEERTLTDYVQSWLKRRLPRLTSSLTQERYVAALGHVLDEFGSWRVSAIDRIAIEEWLVKPRKRPYAAETKNGWLRIFLDVMRTAVQDLNLARDPTIGIKPLPVAPHPHKNSLTPDELSRFLKIARRDYPQWYALLVLGFAIGARPGELRPLRWDVDLNLATGLLVIQRSQRGKHLGPTKTKKTREFHLPGEVLDVLRWHRRQLLSQKHPGIASGLLFPSVGKIRKPPAQPVPLPATTAEQRRRDYYRLYRRSERERKRAGKAIKSGNAFISPSALDKPFRMIAKTAGIQGRLTPKAMRRTFNDALRSRVADLVIRSITGHQSLEMQNRYSTIAPHEQTAAIATVIHLAGGPGLVPSEAPEQDTEAGTTVGTTKAALTGPGGPSAALTDSSNSSKTGAGEGT